MVEYLKLIEKHQDSYAVKMLDGANVDSWTYLDYLRDIRRCAYQLDAKLGPIEGKHICILANADYRYMVLLGAIIFSRAVAVPLNNYETVENLLYAVKTADADVIISSECTQKESFKDLTVVSEEQLFDDISESTYEKELHDFTDEEAKNLALILFTSGTTSLSKGVSLSVESLFAKARSSIFNHFFNGRDNGNGSNVYTNFPLYHMTGIFLWLVAPLVGFILVMSKDPKRVLVDLENNTIDFAVVIPAMVKMWSNIIKRGGKNRLGQVKSLITGGAAIDSEFIKLFLSEGIAFTKFYGLTETGSAVTANFDMEKHIDSIGKAIDGAEVFCVDGEICVKTWSSMMSYYNNPAETNECLKDGVIYTGDLGYVDEDGYIYITGRKKNLIILSGGENVSPEEIESKVYENPLIKECIVFEKNDRIAVEVYADMQDEASIREYISNLNQSMPAYKRIYFVEFRDTEFEKTASGKIKR